MEDLVLKDRLEESEEVKVVVDSIDSGVRTG